MVERIFVELQFDLEKPTIRVGELVMNDKLIHFKCSKEYLTPELELSPFKFPKSEEIFTSDPRLFDGLPGLFFDSLPDSWGRLLVDRKLSQEGINTKALTPIDRLAIVGKNGPGALIYVPERNFNSTVSNFDLDVLAKESDALIVGKETDVIEQLFQLGGSSGGARPKIELMYNPQTGQLASKSNQATLEPTNPTQPTFEDWIIKFPSRYDEPDIAHIEYAYYLMAKKAGINMMESKLFTGKSGKNYFGTKRFDHQAGKRLHAHSVSGLLHDDFRFSQIDYGHIIDAGFELTKRVKTREEIFRLATFNLYTHNRDDHGKNFSFLMNEKGEWKFAPAYDLTFSSSSHGHHSTTFAGEGLNPNAKHLIELARVFNISDAPHIIEEVKEAVGQWLVFAKEAGVSTSSKNKIWGVLQKLITN